MATLNAKWYLSFDSLATEDAYRAYSLLENANTLRGACGILVVLLALGMALFFDSMFIVAQCGVLITVTVVAAVSTFFIKSHVAADVGRVVFVCVWSVTLLWGLAPYAHFHLHGFPSTVSSEFPNGLLRVIALQFAVMLASNTPTRLFLPLLGIFMATQVTLFFFMVRFSNNTSLFLSQLLYTFTLVFSGMWALYHKEQAARAHFLMLLELNARRRRISTLQENMKSLPVGDIPSSNQFSLFDVGVHTEIGGRPCNEDRHSIHQASDHGFFAVYDGHSGDLAAQYCADHLYDVIKASPAFQHGDIDTALIDGHCEVEDKVLDLCSQLSAADGTTTVCALIFGEVLYVANVGDSEAILCRGNGRIQVLSRLHQPTNPEEALRVVQEGGRLYRQRIGHPIINPAVASIAVSRSIGDLAYKRLKDGHSSGLSAAPHVEATTLTGRDMFLLLASDGVFEAMDHTECVRFINNMFQEHHNAASAAEALCLECIERGSCDNVTAVIVMFQSPSAGTLRGEGDAHDSVHDSIHSMQSLEDEATQDLRKGCLGVSFVGYNNWILSHRSLSNEFTWTFIIMTRVFCSLLVVLTHDNVLPLMMLVGTPAALVSYILSTLVGFHKYVTQYHTTTFLLMQSIAVCMFWRKQDVAFLCLLAFTTMHINLFAVPSVLPMVVSSVFQFVITAVLMGLAIISPESLVYLFVVLGTSLWFSSSVAMCRRREYWLRMGCESTLAEEKTLANCLVKAQQRGLIAEKALIPTSEIGMPPDAYLSSQSQSSVVEHYSSFRVGTPLMGGFEGEERIPTISRPLFGPVIAQFSSLFLVFRAPRLEAQFKSFHLLATRKYGRVLAVLTFISQIGLLVVELHEVNGVEIYQRDTARTAYIAIRCATMAASVCVFLLLRGSAPIDFDRYVLAGAYIVFILMDVLLAVVDSFVFEPPVGITLVFTLKVIVLHFYAPSIFFVDMVKLDVLGFGCSIVRHVYPYHVMGQTSTGVWLSALSPIIFFMGLLGAAVLESRQRRLFVLLTKAQKHDATIGGTLEKIASMITSKVERTSLGYFSPPETEHAFRKYYVSDTLRFLRLVLLVLSAGLSALGTQDAVLFQDDTESMRAVLTMRLSAIMALVATALATYTRVFSRYSQIIMGTAGLMCVLLGFASFVVALQSRISAQIFQEAVLNHHSSACLMLFLIVTFLNYHLITAVVVSVSVVLSMVVAYAVIGFTASSSQWFYFCVTVAISIPPAVYHEHRQRSHFLIWLHLKHVLGVSEDYGEGNGREVVEEHLVSTRRMLSAGVTDLTSARAFSDGCTPSIVARAGPSSTSGLANPATSGVPGAMNTSGTPSGLQRPQHVLSDEEETTSSRDDEHVLSPLAQTMVPKTLSQSDTQNAYRQSCTSEGSRQLSEGSDKYHRRQRGIDWEYKIEEGEIEESLHDSFANSFISSGKDATFMNYSMDLSNKKHASADAFRFDYKDAVSTRKLVRYHSTPSLGLAENASTLSGYPSASVGVSSRHAARPVGDHAGSSRSLTSHGASSQSLHLTSPTAFNAPKIPSLPPSQGTSHLGAKTNPAMATVSPGMPSLPLGAILPRSSYPPSPGAPESAHAGSSNDSMGSLQLDCDGGVS